MEPGDRPDDESERVAVWHVVAITERSGLRRYRVTTVLDGENGGPTTATYVEAEMRRARVGRVRRGGLLSPCERDCGLTIGACRARRGLRAALGDRVGLR